MESDLLTDFHWKQQIMMTSDEIKGYVELVKEANLKRRYQYLNDKYHENEEKNEHMMTEMLEIMRQLKH
jgi:hypothetical protein